MPKDVYVAMCLTHSLGNARWADGLSSWMLQTGGYALTGPIQELILIYRNFGVKTWVAMCSGG